MKTQANRNAVRCCRTGPLRLIAVILMVLIASCAGDRYTSDTVRIDLDDIRDRDTLRAITTYSSTSYFVYRGRPMGFEFELLERLADRLDVNLKIVLADNLDSLFAMLHRGEGDIVAHSLAITGDRARELAFTAPIATTHQVLVQRKPKNWRQMKRHEIEPLLVRDPADLIGKEVHVRQNSSYFRRLVNLNEEIGGEIKIVPAEGSQTTEELIKMVAAGVIDYTVADQNIAYIHKTYHPILDVATPLSLSQRIAWAVRPSSPDLLEAVNEWLGEIKRTPDYYTIYNKYFKNRKEYRRRFRSQYFTMTGDKISQYDSLFRVHAREIGWDWRLLAAMVYQESQFDSQAESWAGAIGLMQMMPATAEQFGVTNLRDPHRSLDAGEAYLAYLQEEFADVADTVERIKFVLASFNVGENHVRDARRLAAADGADPDVWTDGVDEYMLKLSDPAYFNDEPVKWGFSRGEEPVAYVADILDRFDHYRLVLPPGE